MRWITSVLVVAALAIAPAFAAAPLTVVLDVTNMTCSLCPITVKKSLEKVPGVAGATVDLNKKTATVRFDANKVGAAAMVKATTEAGFPSTVRK